MKKISIQVKIGLLLIVSVILISASCYLSYRNLSSIVSSIQINLNPELRMVTIRGISRDLETADNSIRIYTISRDTSDLSPYYSIIGGIDEKVNNLRHECSGDTILLNQADTISSLIEENIVIWNEILYLIDHDNAAKSLKMLSEKINKVPEKTGILKRVFSPGRNKTFNEHEIISNIVEIEKQRKITSGKLINGEAQLATTGKRIRDKFYDLLIRMEDQTSHLVLEKGKAANNLAESTYTWLLLFSVSGGLLAILVLIIIVRYLRNTHAYQVALEKSKIEAEDLARTKEAFMANMSHEIRSPVTAISGFTEQLLHENPDENTKRSLSIIKSASDHLVRIIDDILDFSRLQSGKLKLEKINFSIKQILEEVYNLFEQQARQKNNSLNYSIDPGTPDLLLGDPYRLKQIIMNLVGNAVKFTENGSVTFMVSGIRSQSDNIDLIIEVTDTGIGIDEDKLKIIFDDFTQADVSTARKYGGTGLGLSIVKQIVDLHQGTISCESRKNQGTKITCHLLFTIGKKDNLKKDVITTLSVPEEITKLKILIVDDEEYNRLLFKKILERWNITFDTRENSMDALEILKTRKYDILFMDLRMPGIDGLKATRFIRDEMKISDAEMKVICISAAPMKEERDRCIKAGMNAFIQKPFTEEILLNTILECTGYKKPVVEDGPAESDVDSPPEYPGIDLANLKHISGGDKKFIKQMLITFNSTTGKDLKEMQEAAVSGQWKLVADLAHKMLPPCRHLGATKLTDLLMKIEQSSNSQSPDIEAVKVFTGNSLIEFESVSRQINELISKMN